VSRPAHPALIPDQRRIDDPVGACLDGPGIRLDNDAFAERVRAASARLAARGVERGTVVAAMMPNCTEFVVLLFAAWRLGAILTPINPALTTDECGYQLLDSGAAVVVADPVCLSRIPDGPHDVLLLADLSSDEVEHGDPPVSDPDSVALLIYTSGTTARPKGVMLTHANVFEMARIWVDWLAASARDRCLLILPLFHVNGIMVSVVGPLLAGGSVVIGPRFEAATFWDVVARERPTYFSAVPTILTSLMARDIGSRDAASSLRFVGCGAAPASAELLRSFEERFATPVIEGYGLSECTVAATINPLSGDRKPGTVGLPLPGITVAVMGPSGDLVAGGASGEVVIKGATVMRGYLNMPDETGAALRDGWLHTGDVGHIDPDGYLVISDRIKDLIIWSGENVSAKEVETVIGSHPAVLQASVVGRAHERYGEEPVAFVSLKAGFEVSSAELVAHCAVSLARFKVPREVWVLPELPTNAVGKLVKQPLRAWLSAQSSAAT
jgi:long-chain acyl-CoA synthetase